MRTIQIRSCVLISSVVLFATAAFKAKFNSIKLLLKSLLERVVTAEFSNEREALQTMVLNASRRKSALKMFQLLTGEVVAHCEHEAEKFE